MQNRAGGFADFESTVERGSAVNFGADSGLCLGSWVLNELWIIGLSSALIGVLISSSKLFLCCKLWCETVIGIVLCYSHQACCLLYYLCEITSNNGIHIYLSGCYWIFGFVKKSTNLAEKGANGRLCIPLFTPQNGLIAWGTLELKYSQILEFLPTMLEKRKGM